MIDAATAAFIQRYTNHYPGHRVVAAETIMRYLRSAPILVLIFLIGRHLSAQEISGTPSFSRNIIPGQSLDLSSSLPTPEIPSLSGFSSLTRYLKKMESLAANDFPNNPVQAMAWYKGSLIVGGDFNGIGDASFNYIARWDGTGWHPLGGTFEGVDGPVETILVDGDKVYVGGNFTRAGTVATRNIAVWDGATDTWSGFGGGVGGTLRNTVSTIALHDGQLYVGGSFIAAGTTVAANIARWDGRRWHRVGTGVNNPVRALYIEGDYLYTGGEFTVTGNVHASGIARYHFTTDTWESMGVDVQGRVNAIISDSKYFYAGGAFDSADGQLVNNIIRIDKQSGAWSPMGTGIQGYSFSGGGRANKKGIETMILVGNSLFVGGTLTQAFVPSGPDGIMIAIAGAAEWNGQAWSNLAYSSAPGTPIVSYPGGPRKAGLGPPTVYDIVSNGGDTLIMGGDFYGITTGSSPYICTYSWPTNLYSPFKPGGVARDAGGNPTTEIRTAENASELKERNSTSTLRDESLSSLSRTHSGTADPSLLIADDCADPANDRWLPAGPDPSTDNGVLALDADASEAYAGGTFVNIFGVPANGIAVRKNQEWGPLDDGTAIGVDGYVYTIRISGSKVYIGGQFAHAGGIQANNIAVWDRVAHTWSTLGTGITGDEQSPAFVSDIVLQGGNVYVGGNFSHAGGTDVNNIALWKNGTWSGLGSGIDGTVDALEFFKGDLYAGGSFSRAGNITSNAIALWDGEEWKGMDGGLNGHVNDIATYITDLDTSIVIGGGFTKDINPPDPSGIVHNLIWWNGTAWTPKGTLAPSEPGFVDVNGEVRSLMMVGFDLYVAGKFSNAKPRGTGEASSLLTNIAFFNIWPFQGAPVPMWHTMAGGLNGNVNALAISGDEILVGGDFTRTINQGESADHIGLWNLLKQEWRWAGNPTALGPVQNLIRHKNTLYASGSFTSQDIGLFEVENYVVHLAPSGWRIVQGKIRGTPYDLATTSDDEIVMGGAIISSDNGITVNVARWNSATGKWNPLTAGSGVASLEDISFVGAVAADKDHIYVGGEFNIADTLTVRNIACWDRKTESWKRLGDGLNGVVTALAIDSDGTLYAGGSFRNSGSKAVDRIARWDGTSWQPLGDGMNGSVFSLLIDNGMLYVGGTFTRAGLIPANNVARWDIAKRTWSALGQGLNSDFQPVVDALTLTKGSLFAAGKFEVSGTDTIRNVARWNPGGWWDKLGTGADALVTSLAIDDANGVVYAGGHFLTAGCKPLHYVASWQDPTLSVRSDEGSSAGIMRVEGNPNPFSTSTTITLRIPEGKARSIKLRLFDITGREVRTLLDASLTSGNYNLPLEGKDLSAGVYLLRLESDQGTESRQLVKW